MSTQTMPLGSLRVVGVFPRTYWSQCREMLLMAITLNLMILAVLRWIIKVFYRADLSPFPRPLQPVREEV
jgi:hypothetical protein